MRVICLLLLLNLGACDAWNRGPFGYKSDDPGSANNDRRPDVDPFDAQHQQGLRKMNEEWASRDRSMLARIR